MNKNKWQSIGTVLGETNISEFYFSLKNYKAKKGDIITTESKIQLLILDTSTILPFIFPSRNAITFKVILQYPFPIVLYLNKLTILNRHTMR